MKKMHDLPAVLRNGLAASIITVACALSANAGDYVCANWPSPDGTRTTDAHISLFKRMIVFQDEGAQVTARMFFGTLTRHTYLEETSAITIYGDPVKRVDGTPTFGKVLTVQRHFYDKDAPRISQTTCRERK